LEATVIDSESPEATEAFEALVCPNCSGELTEPHRFNLMFKTFMSPVEDTANKVFLCPGTAKCIFVNFKNVLKSSRKKLPFGIGQTGKSLNHFGTK
jgi:glycyl-tRNA synthetase